MKKLVTLIAITMSLLTAQAEDGWVLTLGGKGSTEVVGTGESAAGLEVSIGHTGKVLLPAELGLRQSLSYTTNGDDTLVAGTKVYADFTVLNFKKLDLFVGANGGAQYGNTPLTWSVAPEAGLRFWVVENVAVVGRVEYPYDLNPARFRESLDYNLLLQVKF